MMKLNYRRDLKLTMNAVRKVYLYCFISTSFNIIIIKEMDDGCTTAAEMYACGKEKEPAIVDAILGSSKGNATVVCVTFT